MFAVAKIVGLRTPPRSTVARPFDFVVGLSTYYWKETWVSSDADSRLALESEDVNRVTWKERGAGGQSIARIVKFAPSEEKATIDCENTADVLQFLGFQPDLTGDILTRTATLLYDAYPQGCDHRSQVAWLTRYQRYSCSPIASQAADHGFLLSSTTSIKSRSAAALDLQL
jgi:hypothetical protein